MARFVVCLLGVLGVVGVMGCHAIFSGRTVVPMSELQAY